MIKEFGYSAGAVLKAFNVPTPTSANRGGQVLLRLRGDLVGVNTAVSVLERLLAYDFTGYYDAFDASKGVCYLKGLNKAYVTFDRDSISYVCSSGAEGNLSVRSSNASGVLHCVRYVASGELRSFLTSTSDKILESSFGCSTFKNTGRVPTSSLIYIQSLINKLVGAEVLSLDISTLAVSWDFTKLGEGSIWTEDDIKLMYLILTECAVEYSHTEKVILLSNIEFFSNHDEDTLRSFIAGVCRVSKSSTVVFTNESSFGSLGNNLGVVDIAV